MLVDLNVQHKTVMIVGENLETESRARQFLDADAKVIVVSTNSTTGLKTLAASGRITIVSSDFMSCYQNLMKEYDPYLLVSTTSNEEKNSAIANIARSHGKLVYVVDSPNLNDFNMPAVAKVGPIRIGIATGGLSPAMARELRKRVERIIQPEDMLQVHLQGQIRYAIKTLIQDPELRRECVYRILKDPLILQLLREDRLDEAKDVAMKHIATTAKVGRRARLGKGKVYLVGAGPGDPKLLTLRAFDIIGAADIVIFDRLVSEQILKLIPEDASKIYVGKRPRSKDAISQSEINQILIQQAEQGKTVVRLKSGDPLIFSRGGEEAEALRAAGIEFEIIPGISSALGAPAYAGIPLTHRDFSSSVAIVTGQEDPASLKSRINWSQLAQSVDTIVILMGVERLQQITKELIAGGLSKETPVAAIESGTTENQKTTLFNLESAALGHVKHLVRPPSIIVIGEVANMAKRFNRTSTNYLVDCVPVPAKV